MLESFDKYLDCGILLHGAARAGEPVVKYISYKDDEVSTRKFSPLEFLAEASQHIPLMWEQSTRYFGLYSARTRGASKHEAEVFDCEHYEPRRKASISWARGILCANLGIESWRASPPP